MVPEFFARQFHVGWLHISFVHNSPLVNYVQGTHFENKLSGFAYSEDGNFFSTLRIGAWFINFDITR